MWGCSSSFTIESNYICTGGTTSNLMSGGWNFLPITAFPIVISSNLSVTGRKFHLSDIKFEVIPPVQM